MRPFDSNRGVPGEERRASRREWVRTEGVRREQVEQVHVLEAAPPLSDASSHPSCVLLSGARGCSNWWPRNPACSWRGCTSRRVCAALGGNSAAADGVGCSAPKHRSVRTPEWQAIRRLSAAKHEGRQRV